MAKKKADDWFAKWQERDRERAERIWKPLGDFLHAGHMWKDIGEYARGEGAVAFELGKREVVEHGTKILDNIKTFFEIEAAKPDSEKHPNPIAEISAAGTDRLWQATRAVFNPIRGSLQIAGGTIAGVYPTTESEKEISIAAQRITEITDDGISRAFQRTPQAMARFGEYWLNAFGETTISGMVGGQVPTVEQRIASMIPGGEEAIATKQHENALLAMKNPKNVKAMHGIARTRLQDKGLDPYDPKNAALLDEEAKVTLYATMMVGQQGILMATDPLLWGAGGLGLAAKPLKALKNVIAGGDVRAAYSIGGRLAKSPAGALRVQEIRNAIHTSEILGVDAVVGEEITGGVVRGFKALERPGVTLDDLDDYARIERILDDAEHGREIVAPLGYGEGGKVQLNSKLYDELVSLSTELKKEGINPVEYIEDITGGKGVGATELTDLSTALAKHILGYTQRWETKAEATARLKLFKLRNKAATPEEIAAQRPIRKILRPKAISLGKVELAEKFIPPALDPHYSIAKNFKHSFGKIKYMMSITDGLNDYEKTIGDLVEQRAVEDYFAIVKQIEAGLPVSAAGLDIETGVRITPDLLLQVANRTMFKPTSGDKELSVSGMLVKLYGKNVFDDLAKSATEDPIFAGLYQREFLSASFDATVEAGFAQARATGMRETLKERLSEGVFESLMGVESSPAEELLLRKVKIPVSGKTGVVEKDPLNLALEQYLKYHADKLHTADLYTKGRGAGYSVGEAAFDQGLEMLRRVIVAGTDGKVNMSKRGMLMALQQGGITEQQAVNQVWNSFRKYITNKGLADDLFKDKATLKALYEQSSKSPFFKKVVENAEDYAHPNIWGDVQSMPYHRVKDLLDEMEEVKAGGGWTGFEEVDRAMLRKLVARMSETIFKTNVNQLTRGEWEQLKYFIENPEKIAHVKRTLAAIHRGEDVDDVADFMINKYKMGYFGPVSTLMPLRVLLGQMGQSNLYRSLTKNNDEMSSLFERAGQLMSVPSKRWIKMGRDNKMAEIIARNPGATREEVSRLLLNKERQDAWARYQSTKASEQAAVAEKYGLSPLEIDIINEQKKVVAEVGDLLVKDGHIKKEALEIMRARGYIEWVGHGEITVKDTITILGNIIKKPGNAKFLDAEEASMFLDKTLNGLNPYVKQRAYGPMAKHRKGIAPPTFHASAINHHYIEVGARKIYLDRMAKEIESVIKLPGTSEKDRHVLNILLDSVYGTAGILAKGKVPRLTKYVNQFAAIIHEAVLGFAPDSVFANEMGGHINMFAEFGPELMFRSMGLVGKGLKSTVYGKSLPYEKEFAEFMKTTYYQPFKVDEYIGGGIKFKKPGKISAYRRASMTPMSTSENQMRFQVWWMSKTQIAEKEAETGIKLSQAVKDDIIHQKMADIMYLYGKPDTPLALQTPLAKALFPFMTFQINQLATVSKWAKTGEVDKLARLTAANMFLAGLGNETGKSLEKYTAEDYLPFSLIFNNFKRGRDPLRQLSFTSNMLGTAVRDGFGWGNTHTQLPAKKLGIEALKKSLPSVVPSLRGTKKIADAALTSFVNKIHKYYNKGELKIVAEDPPEFNGKTVWPFIRASAMNENLTFQPPYQADEFNWVNAMLNFGAGVAGIQSKTALDAREHMESFHDRKLTISSLERKFWGLMNEYRAKTEEGDTDTAMVAYADALGHGKILQKSFNYPFPEEITSDVIKEKYNEVSSLAGGYRALEDYIVMLSDSKDPGERKMIANMIERVLKGMGKTFDVREDAGMQKSWFLNAAHRYYKDGDEKHANAFINFWDNNFVGEGIPVDVQRERGGAISYDEIRNHVTKMVSD